MGLNMNSEQVTQEIESILPSFIGGGQLYHFNPFARNTLLTEGAKFIADKAGAYWLMDVIASAQLSPKVRREPFQVWTIKLNEKGPGCTVTATDGDKSDNGDGAIVIYKQRIGYTDFPIKEFTLWLEEANGRKVILLPREH